MRYSCALALLLTISFALSGEGYRLRRTGEHDAAAKSPSDSEEPSRLQDDPLEKDEHEPRDNGAVVSSLGKDEAWEEEQEVQGADAFISSAQEDDMQGEPDEPVAEESFSEDDEEEEEEPQDQDTEESPFTDEDANAEEEGIDDEEEANEPSLVEADDNNHEQEEAEEEESEAGKCTETDQAIINEMGSGKKKKQKSSWPTFVNKCTSKSASRAKPAKRQFVNQSGYRGYRLISAVSAVWKGNKGTLKCMRNKKISPGCATCFANLAKLGFHNTRKYNTRKYWEADRGCAGACVVSWRSGQCLQCTRGAPASAQETLNKCTGMSTMPSR